MTETAGITFAIGSTRKPDMTIYRNGRVDIGAAASRLLDLHDGDVVDVCTDGEEFYLFVRMRAQSVFGQHEGIVRRQDVYGDSKRVYSKKISEMLMQGHDEPVIRIPSGELVTLSGIGSALTLIPRLNLTRQ